MDGRKLIASAEDGCSCERLLTGLGGRDQAVRRREGEKEKQ